MIKRHVLKHHIPELSNHSCEFTFRAEPCAGHVSTAPPTSAMPLSAEPCTGQVTPLRSTSPLSDTPNLPTNIVDFRGFDSSIILILRGGILMSMEDFPESSSQAIVVGIMLVGRSGVHRRGYARSLQADVLIVVVADKGRLPITYYSMQYFNISQYNALQLCTKHIVYTTAVYRMSSWTKVGRLATRTVQARLSFSGI